MEKTSFVTRENTKRSIFRASIGVIASLAMVSCANGSQDNKEFQTSETTPITSEVNLSYQVETTLQETTTLPTEPQHESTTSVEHNEPATTVQTIETIPTVPRQERFTIADFEVGSKVGTIMTSDGSVYADLMLTDNISEPTRTFAESPELDYIDQGAGISSYYGLPGLNNNAVILAHNTKAGKDYFRNLGDVTSGTELYIEYQKNNESELLTYVAITDPIKVGDDKEAAEIIYNQDIPDYESTVALYTCDTINGDSSSRIVVFFALKD
jgi:LPXTG-site transpeptidase (sortase) family protein